MFSTSNSSLTAVCVVAMMMVMVMVMSEAAAMPKPDGQSKHSAKTHRKSLDEALVETVTLELDPKALVPIRTARPLQNASISPWTYNVSLDDTLFPPVLSEARCVLQGCRNSEGHEDLNLESRPIMHQVLLLRRVKSTGEGGAGHRYHYRLESRLIAVGCTCVKPILQHQD